MQIEIRPQHSRNLQRWRELQADRELARLPHRIETDRFGRIIMSPPPALNHSVRQSKIFQLLTRLLPDGEALAECALQRISEPDLNAGQYNETFQRALIPLAGLTKIQSLDLFCIAPWIKWAAPSIFS